MSKSFIPQPLSMISMIYDLSKTMLESSQENLENFEEAQDRPHVLDDDIVERSIKLYTKQNEDIVYFISQCKEWRKENLTSKQEQQVTACESNYKELRKSNQRILFLMDDYKDRTIEKILQKDDIEMALDFLMGTISPLSEGKDMKKKEMKENKRTARPHGEKDASLFKEYKENRNILGKLITNLFAEVTDSQAFSAAKILGIYEAGFEESIRIRNDAEMSMHAEHCLLYFSLKDTPLLQLILGEKKPIFKPQERKLIEALLKSYFTIFKIEEIYKNGAIKVSDLMTNEKRILFDKTMNEQQSVGNYVLCTVLDMGDYIMTGSGTLPFSIEYPGGQEVLKIFSDYLQSIDDISKIPPKKTEKCVSDIFRYCFETKAFG